MILIIFLDVQSAFNVKKSSRCFPCCVTMKSSLTVGLPNDPSMNTECARQGGQVSAPPAHILNQNFQISWRGGTRPRKGGRYLLKVTQQVSGEARRTLGSDSITLAPFIKASDLLASRNPEPGWPCRRGQGRPRC